MVFTFAANAVSIYFFKRGEYPLQYEPKKYKDICAQAVAMVTPKFLGTPLFGPKNANFGMLFMLYGEK